MTFNKYLGIVLCLLCYLSSCSTPKNIEYLQNFQEGMTISATSKEIITIQPGDEISIIVHSRNPNIAAMFNLPIISNRIGSTTSLSSSSSINSSSSQVSSYLIDSNGDINFPILGKLHISGMNREEIASMITTKIIESGQASDPVVVVEYMNLGVTIVGEVSRPGRFKIDRDRFTFFDALGSAGDLTINGSRTDIMLKRQEGDRDKVYKIDLTNAYSIYESPAYYIQQGDVIYVAPSDKRKRDSTVNGNNVMSVSFWLSVTSLLSSLVVLGINLIQKFM